jgi:FkbM family methyltransferase
MKRVILDLLRRRNIHVTRNSYPKGANLVTDLNRYGLTRHFDSVVDIGANVGGFSSLFLESFPNVSSIIAVEPEPANFQKLKSRFAGGRVRCLECAVGEKEGTATLNLSSYSTMHSLSHQTGESKSVSVRIQRLPQIIDLLPSESRVFIKTDTEGNDVQVLRGGFEILQSGRCPLVLSEVGFCNPPVQSRFSEVYDVLKAAGFDLWGFYNQTSSGPSRSMNFCDALFLHRESTIAQ